MNLNEIIAKGLIASENFESNLVNLLKVNPNLAKVLAEGLKVPTQEEVEEKKEKEIASLLRDYKDSEFVSCTVGEISYDKEDFRAKCLLNVKLKKESGEFVRSVTLYF